MLGYGTVWNASYVEVLFKESYIFWKKYFNIPQSKISKYSRKNCRQNSTRAPIQLQQDLVLIFGFS